MSKLFCVGELLIDFQAKGEGALRDASEFTKRAGGAPANACVQAVRLGASGVYLSQVGKDAFGDFLISALEKEGVDTSHIAQSPDHDTSLAFVSFGANGERQFAFYRRTAADLYFEARDFADATINEGDVLEFGSVALKTASSRGAHADLIQRAKKVGALVCFDPNLRFDLWEDKAELCRIVCDSAKAADVIKLADDEATFLTGVADGNGAAKKFLFDSGAKMLALTRGARGARLYLSDGGTFDFEGYKVNAVDTTGAGDAFFGGLIAELMRLGITPQTIVGEHDYLGILKFACACGSCAASGFGAIDAMGDRKKIESIVKQAEKPNAFRV